MHGVRHGGIDPARDGEHPLGATLSTSRVSPTTTSTKARSSSRSDGSPRFRQVPIRPLREVLAGGEPPLPAEDDHPRNEADHQRLKAPRIPSSQSLRSGSLPCCQASPAPATPSRVITIASAPSRRSFPSRSSRRSLTPGCERVDRASRSGLAARRSAGRSPPTANATNSPRKSSASANDRQPRPTPPPGTNSAPRRAHPDLARHHRPPHQKPVSTRRSRGSAVGMRDRPQVEVGDVGEVVGVHRV